jgi:phosphohistidine swiveling domain-containing protein
MARLLRAVVCVSAMAIVATMLPTSSWAQMTRGGISGTVRDQSGGVVPGATVTVTNLDTNAAQTVVSDAQGFFRVAALEAGRYMVATELAGFRKVEQRDIIVRPSLETPVDVQLRPAVVGEEVTVTAESPLVGLNRTNPTIASTINARAIEDLPLPGGRNLNNLILTVPNASSTTGQGTYAVNGNRPRNNNYMVDGSDNNDISVTISTSQLVPEAVAEFQVLQNPYSVEFGRNSGGQINVITKSGTNRFSGDAWDYYQASGLNSLTNVEKDNGLKTPARLIRHQMGGGLGGPIYHDKAFFFGLYQRDTQRPADRPSATAVTIPTPTGFAALAAVPLGAGQTAASRQAVLDRISFLQDLYGQNPTFRNLTTTLVNGVGIETGDTNFNIVDPSTYHTGLGRVDIRPFTSDTFTVRYSLNDRVDENFNSTQFGPLFAGNQDLVDTNIAASNAHIFSSRMLNEARFSLVRRNLDFPENDPVSPTAAITGAFTIGGPSNFPQSRVTDSYQFSDTMTWTLSKHTMKFGADVRYNRVDNQAAFNSKGNFTFDNLQAYMNNIASRVQQALQTSSWFATQWQTYFFAQDDFRVTPELTLNLGLRYETSDVPFGMFGATDELSLNALVPGPVKRDTNNWAPRTGFAWNPRTQNWFFGNSETVIRGGFGIAYDVIFYNLLTVNASNYPRIVTLDQTDQRNLYPNLLTGSAQPTFDPLAAWTNSAQDTEQPESRFYSLTLQRAFRDYTFEVGYSGSRGYKGINQIDENPATLTAEQAALVQAARSTAVIPTVQQRRIFPQFGSRVTIPATVGPAGNDVEARSEYNAVFFSGNKRFSHGLQFGGSYTYSRWYSNNDASLGEGGTDGSSQRPQDYFDYGAEWSRSQFDRPHRFTVSYVYEIPGPKSGILGRTLGGWQISGVTQTQSGRPFTIVTGVDSSGDGNTGSDRPNINPAGSFDWDADHKTFVNNGFYVVPLGNNNLPLNQSLGDGNSPRNGQRSAGFWNTDLALSKRIDIAGTTRLIVRIDAFNALNQDNYGIPTNNMSSANFGRNTNNWGRRILQLSGKLSW